MKAICIERDTRFSEAKNWGFDTVVCWNFKNYNKKVFLDNCQNNGLKVIPFLHHLFRENNWNEAVQIVNLWKTHPAISHWYIIDEPNMSGYKFPVDKQVAFYKKIKAADPNHPLIINFIARDPRPYYSTSAFDIAAIDVYPVRGDISDWKSYQKARLNEWISATGNRDIIPILQCHYGGYSPLIDPRQTIKEQYNIFKEYGMTNRGYMAYAYWGGAGAGSIGISGNVNIRDEVIDLNKLLPFIRITPPPTEKYITIDTQKINIPKCIGKTADGKWWAVWNNTRYWIRRWSIIQSMQNQGIMRVDVSSYPASSISIPPFPENLIYKLAPAPPPPEIITTKNIIHTCKAKISYNVSSYIARNVTLYCPHCKNALAEKGVKGSEKLIALPPEIITTKEITCAKCKSILKVSVSSYTDKNKQLVCPICGAVLSVKGIKVDVLSTPFIDVLKRAIADLDAKIIEIEKAIKAVRDKIKEFSL